MENDRFEQARQAFLAAHDAAAAEPAAEPAAAGGAGWLWLYEAEAALLAAATSFERFGMRSQQNVALFNLCALHAAQSRPADVLRVAQGLRGR